MTVRPSLRTLGVVALAALAALVGACAQAPVTDEAAPAPRIVRQDGPREDAVRRHRELAREARAAGDLATAVDHLHVVAMLTDDEAAKRDAEALRTEIRRLVRESLETGRNAMRTGASIRFCTTVNAYLESKSRRSIQYCCCP